MKVLICLDNQSAKIILQEALAFLQGFADVKIHILTIEDMAMVSAGTSDFDEVALLRTFEHESNRLAQLVAMLMQGKEYTFYNEVGYPSDEILKKANDISADLLVLGTHDHTALDHLLNASIVEKVLRHTPCKVLVLPLPKTPVV